MTTLPGVIWFGSPVEWVSGRFHQRLAAPSVSISQTVASNRFWNLTPQVYQPLVKQSFSTKKTDFLWNHSAKYPTRSGIVSNPLAPVLRHKLFSVSRALTAPGQKLSRSWFRGCKSLSSKSQNFITFPQLFSKSKNGNIPLTVIEEFWKIDFLKHFQIGGILREFWDVARFGWFWCGGGNVLDPLERETSITVRYIDRCFD